MSKRWVASLLDGTLTMVISHPLAQLCDQTIGGMIEALNPTTARENFTRVLPFEIYTRENI